MIIVYSPHWMHHLEGWGKYHRIFWTKRPLQTVGASDCVWMVSGTWEDD